MHLSSITVTDAGSSGRLDEARTPIYRDFVRALHARLALAPEAPSPSTPP
jgi:hypothetical protein